MSILPERDESRNTGAAGQTDHAPIDNENQAGDAPATITTTAPGESTDQPCEVNTQGVCGPGDGAEPAVLPDANEVQQIIDSLRRTPLAENHLADLRASGLSDETIRAAGLCSAPAAATRLLGFHDSPALVFPYPEHPGYIRIKPDQPRTDREGKTIKYESPRGSRNHLYVPHKTRARLRGMGEPVTTVIITEGEKKALKADQEGFATISVPGVWGWRTCVPELTGISWQGRRAVIAFDSDVTRKADVKAAISALADKLKEEGADVRVILLPDIEGHEKIGLDDFLVARGAEALQGLLDNAKDWFSIAVGHVAGGARGRRPGCRVAADLRANRESRRGRQEQRLSTTSAAAQDPWAIRVRRCPKCKRAARNAAPRKNRQRAANQPAENEPVIRFVAEGPDGRFAGQPEKYGLYDMRTEEPAPTDELRHADHRRRACGRRPAAPARLPRHDHPAGRRAPFHDRRRGLWQQRQADGGHLRGGRRQGGDSLQARDVAYRHLRRKRPGHATGVHELRLERRQDSVHGPRRADHRRRLPSGRRRAPRRLTWPTRSSPSG